MCTVSMVGDHYRDRISRLYPNVYSWPATTMTIPPVSREEFDALKREVEQMKDLLKRAKEYDERNGEPDCEIEEKMDLLRRVAKLVDVNLDDVIGKPA